MRLDLTRIGVALAVLIVSGSPHAPSANAQSRFAPGPPSNPYKTTREEFFLGVKACLEDKGFAVDLDIPEGGITTHETTDEGARNSAVAIHECEIAMDPRRLLPPPRPSDEQMQAWYGYAVAQLACLRAAGYATPDPPPEQVFIDSGGDWDPTKATMDFGGTTVKFEDQRRCEQIKERPDFFDW